MAGISAEKARARAEARRLRIMAKAEQRLDVVNGFAPSKPDHGVAAAASSSPNAEIKSSPIASAASENPTADSSAAEEKRGDESASKGAKRMAAMRRRRYQSKNKTKDADAASAPVSAEKKEEAKKEEVEVKEEEEEKKPAEVKKEESVKDAVEPPESASTTEEANAEPVGSKKVEEVKTASVRTATEQADNKENNQPTTPTPKTTPSEEKKDDTEDAKPKKYMGVARMRRKILKEQKAQRLKDIADAEVMGSPNYKRSGADMERELAVEMATMDVTASMVRKGGGDTRGSLNDVSLGGRTLRNKWWSGLIPPMKLVPRMVTLLLLFVAGLDLGSQPHRSASSLSSLGGDLVARDLVAGVGIAGIGHVESSLTKPWEYGMGGKAAYLVGLAPSSPPTSLPTSFDGDATFCTFNDEMDGECVPPPLSIKSKGDKNKKQGSSGSKDVKSGKQQNNAHVKLMEMEDEFDSSRTRPKGVGTHDDEFSDDPGNVLKSNNIDPLFQVDLDALLENAELPFPINYAAKIAIGFHRTWVYYLWTLPTSLVKKVWSLPKNLLSGWIANPPWVLLITLFIRFATRLLVGNGNAFSLDDGGKKKDSSASGASDKDSGGGGNNLDILGKGMDFAKNYMKSKFPKMTLFMGTMMQVMKVEMYIMFCGVLMGLVVPLARDDYLAWKASGVVGGEEDGGGIVLGNGEL